MKIGWRENMEGFWRQTTEITQQTMAPRTRETFEELIEFCQMISKWFLYLSGTAFG
jgi:hypothetical protein